MRNKKGAAEEQELELRIPAGINEVVDKHTKWLMRKLYNSREKNGDIVFEFQPDGGEAMDIDIPVPELALADNSNAAKEAVPAVNAHKVKCHRQVLIGQSAYFSGLMEFNEMSQTSGDNVTLTVKEYTPEVFEAMI